MSDINPATAHGQTPMYVAGLKGHTEIVEYLMGKLQTKNPPISNGNWTYLHVAASEGNLKIVETIANALSDINPAADDGQTPMYVATLKGHTDIVSFYVDKLQNKNPPCSCTKSNLTPLHIAASEGHLNIVKIIANSLLNINPAADDGQTPMYIAALKGRNVQGGPSKFVNDGDSE